jgi:hypothetical protein
MDDLAESRCKVTRMTCTNIPASRERTGALSLFPGEHDGCEEFRTGNDVDPDPGQLIHSVWLSRTMKSVVT